MYLQALPPCVLLGVGARNLDLHSVYYTAGQRAARNLVDMPNLFLQLPDKIQTHPTSVVGNVGCPDRHRSLDGTGLVRRDLPRLDECLTFRLMNASSSLWDVLCTAATAVAVAVAVGAMNAPLPTIPPIRLNCLCEESKFVCRNRVGDSVALTLATDPPP